MGESEITRLRCLIVPGYEVLKRDLTVCSITVTRVIVSYEYSFIEIYQRQLEQIIAKTQAKKIVAEISMHMVG